MMMIKLINVSMPFHLGNVNCFLIESGSGFVLIDTGSSNGRKALLQEIAKAGCQPGNLKLVILTHGDFDHSGNAAYLRHEFQTRVAMHKGDSAMVEQGDMFAGRKQPNILIRKLLPALSGFGKTSRFHPDLYFTDGQKLNAFGLSGKVLSLPGHSQGSIGILMENGDLFCGDLFENIKSPALGSIMDEPAIARSSANRLKKIKINTIYPGHGKPFLMKDHPHLLGSLVAYRMSSK